MKPIQKDERYTLSKIVSENLKQYILDQRLEPGQKLPSEREFSKQMNVSRSILREALRTLESSGIITIRHGEGAFVKSDSDLSSLIEHLLFMWRLSNKTKDDLLELRCIFESAALEQIILRADDEELQSLEQTARKIGDHHDTKSIQDADIEFHRGLIKSTGNELFIQMTELIIEYFAGVPHGHMGKKERDKSLQDHLDIVEALRGRDASKAKRLLADHLYYSRKYLQSANEIL